MRRPDRAEGPLRGGPRIDDDSAAMSALAAAPLPIPACRVGADPGAETTTTVGFRAATASAIAVVVLLALAGAAAAVDPTCGPPGGSPGPAGVDLQGACVAGEVVRTYTSGEPLPQEQIWVALRALGVGWMLAVIVFGAWRLVSSWVGRRAAPVAPSAYWLCDACRSFNPQDAAACYRCGRPRPAEARIVDASGPPPAVEQRFGRPPEL